MYVPPPATKMENSVFKDMLELKKIQIAITYFVKVMRFNSSLVYLRGRIEVTKDKNLQYSDPRSYIVY